MTDAQSAPKRFDVALEAPDGVSDVGPGVYLEEAPSEGDQITLEDGTRAVVKYMSKGKLGQPVIWARRLSPD